MLANLYKTNNEYGISIEEVENYDLKIIIDITQEKVRELMESPSKVKEYFNK